MRYRVAGWSGGQSTWGLSTTGQASTRWVHPEPRSLGGARFGARVVARVGVARVGVARVSGRAASRKFGSSPKLKHFYPSFKNTEI